MNFSSPNTYLDFLPALRRDRLRKPSFSGSWLEARPCTGWTSVDRSEMLGGSVELLRDDSGLRHRYVIVPWEHSLGPGPRAGLEKAIQKVRETPPPGLGRKEDIRDHVMSAVRAMFPGRECSPELLDAVLRNTIGFGALEVLLRDPRVEDVFIDAPSERNRVYLTLGRSGGTNFFGKCETNLIVSPEGMVGLISRLKYRSGRPFTRSSPVLETDMGDLGVRATALSPPLSPLGYALALRRRAEVPWTLTRLAACGSLDGTVAGLLSFLIDGRSSVLICGARGSGKSSLLSALLFEFPLDQRILTIEDTRELPVEHLHHIGYKVQSLLVDPSAPEAREDAVEEALRVSLRLGESAIVMGEVRGREAMTLYESMRTGKAGSSVLGTIHGDGAREVHDRVVNELGIPAASFASTDIIVTMGLMRPGGGLGQLRRVTEVSEVVRTDEGLCFLPMLVHDGVHRLMDRRMPIIERISRSWGMEYQEALANLEGRIAIRTALQDMATRDPELLSPTGVMAANEVVWKNGASVRSDPSGALMAHIRGR